MTAANGLAVRRALEEAGVEFIDEKAVAPECGYESGRKGKASPDAVMSEVRLRLVRSLPILAKRTQNIGAIFSQVGHRVARDAAGLSATACERGIRNRQALIALPKRLIKYVRLIGHSDDGSAARLWLAF